MNEANQTYLTIIEDSQLIIEMLKWVQYLQWCNRDQDNVNVLLLVMVVSSWVVYTCICVNDQLLYFEYQLSLIVSFRFLVSLGDYLSTKDLNTKQT